MENAVVVVPVSAQQVNFCVTVSVSSHRQTHGTVGLVGTLVNKGAFAPMVPACSHVQRAPLRRVMEAVSTFRPMMHTVALAGRSVQWGNFVRPAIVFALMDNSSVESSVSISIFIQDIVDSVRSVV
tara:strand:+ start:2781 stop:3158 length:378 start_codon:yes stop_codon:yes gene_type:complete